MHRLDRDTSGLLVVARSEEAHAALQEAIRRRELERRYLALVRGAPRSRAGRIDAPLGRDRRDPTRRSLDTEEPREAVTHFEVLELCASTRCSTFAWRPGRTHQIRVHLAAIDLPVSGDSQYGVTRRPRSRAAVPARAPAPLSPPGHRRAEIDITSPLPPDLEAALEQARACRRGEASLARRYGYTLRVLDPFDPAIQPRRGCRRSVRGSARPAGARHRQPTRKGLILCQS